MGNEKTTGPGSISVEGVGTLSGADAKKTSAEGSTWVSEDGRQSYSVVQMGSRQDLNRLQPINETWRRAA